jgi:hypothetical protein
MTLFKRVIVEKRSVIVPLALGVLLNIGAYALVVHPLGVRSAGAADRAAAAVVALRAAERDETAARALVTGKARADQELSTFFDRVLPADQSAAVRLTYASLPAVAKRANVTLLGRRFEVESLLKREAQFGRLRIAVALQCDYRGFRRFIYDLESAPEFVILDDVTLAQTEADRPLTLELEISAYFRLGADGT